MKVWYHIIKRRTMGDQQTNVSLVCFLSCKAKKVSEGLIGLDRKRAGVHLIVMAEHTIH